MSFSAGNPQRTQSPKTLAATYKDPESLRITFTIEKSTKQAIAIP